MATLRRAEPRDAAAAASLILEAAPSLKDIFGDRRLALRAAEASFRAERSEMAQRFGMVAEEGEDVVGLATAFPGRLWSSLKLGTGVVLARTGGARHLPDLVRRGRVLDRLLPPVGRGFLYVSILAVAAPHRGRGTGAQLLERVISGARRLGLGVALDVGTENEGARRLYDRLGFKVTGVRRTTPEDRRLIDVEGSLRMELR